MSDVDIETQQLFNNIVALFTRFGGSFSIIDRDPETGKPNDDDIKHYQVECLANTTTIKLTYSDESEISIVKTIDDITATRFDAETLDIFNIDAVAAMNDVIKSLPM